MIFNKSNHPVRIHKVEVKVWTLRKELEWLIQQRYIQIRGQGYGKIDLDIIRRYYQGEDLSPKEEGKEGDGPMLDTAGNPMDEAAMEMAKAMAGGDDEEDEEEPKEDGEMDQDAIDAMMAGGGDEKKEDAAEDGAMDQDAIDAMMAGGGDEKKEDAVEDGAMDQDAIDAMMAGGDEKKEDAAEDGAMDQDAIDAMMAGGGDEKKEEASESGDMDQAAIDAMMGGGEDKDKKESEDGADEKKADGEKPEGDEQKAGEEKEEEKPEEPPKDDFYYPYQGHQVRQKPDLKVDDISGGNFILSDVDIEEVLMFTQHEFKVGQSIVIELEVPRPFIVSAEVLSCSRYNFKSRIISATRSNFRVRAKFTFMTKGERTQMREFLRSIQPDLPAPKAKAKPQNDDDIGLDDLDDLGI